MALHKLSQVLFHLQFESQLRNADIKSQKGFTAFSLNAEAIKLQLSVISMRFDILNSDKFVRTCITQLSRLMESTRSSKVTPLRHSIKESFVLRASHLWGNAFSNLQFGLVENGSFSSRISHKILF